METDNFHLCTGVFGPYPEIVEKRFDRNKPFLQMQMAGKLFFS